MAHENYDKFFEPAAAVEVEGARVGLCTCRKCGATVMADPRDTTNYLSMHAAWHVETDVAIDAARKQDAA